MEMLKELVQLLPPEKIAQIELIGGNNDPDSMLDKLYRGLLNGDFESEEDAMMSIYGNTGKNKAGFIKLSERLRDRLLNTLFFIDLNKPKFAEYPQAVINSHQQYAQIKLLFAKSARKTGIWLAEGLLQYTQKYELTELTYLLTTDLKYHFGTLDINKARYRKYSDIQQQSFQKLQAENKAMDAYHLVFHKDYGRSKVSESELRSRWDKISKELDVYYGPAASSKFLYYYCNAHAEFYFLDNRNEEIISIVSQSIDYLLGKNYTHRPIVFSLNRLKMIAFFNAKMLDSAISIANEIEELTRENQHNWFVIRYFKALFYIHKKDYTAAQQIKESTFNDIEVGDLKSGLFEIWRTLEAYLEFLSTLTDPEGAKERKTNFRLNKFLNQVPLYQKDKSGRNVTILLVQLLFFLARHNYGRYIDRMDALTQYRRRYLKENNTFRSNCIIRMMVKVGKYGFHPKRVTSYTKKDLWKLKSRQAEISGRSSEVEIIPYEDMWEMVMEMLERNYEKSYYE